MELLVIGDEAKASRLVAFFEDRAVRVRVVAAEDALPVGDGSPDAVVVCGGCAEQLAERLRERWPGVPILPYDEGEEGDAAGSGRPGRVRPGRRRRRAAPRPALHPGEVAFRMAQALHGVDGVDGVAAVGRGGRGRDRVA